MTLATTWPGEDKKLSLPISHASGGLRIRFADLFISLGMFAVSLGVYLITVPRSLASGDSGELTTAAATLGIAHPPGYPLYVLVGRAFALIPLGDVAFRLNLMSAVFGALAVMLVYAIVKEITQSRIGAVSGALTLAFSYHFWGQSLVAEVYTLDAALLAGVIYAFSLQERRRSRRLLYLGFFLIGLSLAHRPTTVLLFPGIIAWILSSGARFRLAEYVRALCWTAPGLLLYLFLPLAFGLGSGYFWSVGYLTNAEPLYVDLTTFAGFRWYVTAEVFHPLAASTDPVRLLGEISGFAGWIWSEFVGVGVVLGLLGIAAAFRRHLSFVLLTAVSFVLIGSFYAAYAAFDKDQMLLPLYLIWALWAGVGAAALIRLADGGSHPTLVANASKAFVLMLPVILLLSNSASLNFAHTQTVENDAKAILSTASRNSILIGGWSEIGALEYYQRVEGIRPDLALVARWSLSDESLHILVDENFGERPIYLLEDAPSLRENYQLVDAGIWFRVEPPEPLVKEGATNSAH